MVAFEPSPADQLIPLLDNFGKNLERFMKPNREFQKAMQMQIANNPKLAQQFADLERAAPGSLSNLGFGDLGKVISAIPESEEAQFNRENRGQIQDVKKKKLDFEQLDSGFSIDRLNGVIDAIKKDPNLRGDMVYKMLTGHTMAGYNTEQSQATIAANKASVSGKAADAEAAQSDAEIAKFQVQKKAYQDALAKMPANIQQIDFLRIAKDLESGKADPTTFAILNTPGADDALKLAVRAIEEDKQRAAMQLYRHQQNGDLKESTKWQDAFQRYRATNSGTIESWYNYMWNDGKDQIESLRKKDPAKLTQDEKDLLHTADAEKQNFDRAKFDNLNKINVAISAQRAQLDKAIKSGLVPEQNLAAAQLQESLNAKAELIGKQIYVKVGDRPDVGKGEKTLGTWFQGKGMYFVDANGNRVRDDEINNDFVDTPANRLKAEALRAYSEIQTAPSKSIALENLKKANPALYDEVIKMKPKN